MCSFHINTQTPLHSLHTLHLYQCHHQIHIQAAMGLYMIQDLRLILQNYIHSGCIFPAYKPAAYHNHPLKRTLQQYYLQLLLLPAHGLPFLHRLHNYHMLTAHPAYITGHNHLQHQIQTISLLFHICHLSMMLRT